MPPISRADPALLDKNHIRTYTFPNMPLIARTEGLSGEPLLTQWLAHILSHPKYQGTLVGFFSGAGVPSDALCDISIHDEEPDSDGNGRPDIEVSSGSLALIIENKFDAGMTKNQPRGYLKVLEKRDAPHKVLAFLVPDARRKELEDILSPHMPKSKPIRIRISTWEELAALLSSTFPNSELIEEFSRDALRRCKVQSPLTPDDYKAASNIMASWLIQHELLKSIKERIQSDTAFKGLSVMLEKKPAWDDDDCYMGMTLAASSEDWVLWVGFWNLLQRKDEAGTPLFGHFYPESKDAKKLYPQFWSKLKEYQSKKIATAQIPGHGIAIPIPLQFTQGKTLREQADNIIRYFVRVLRGEL